MPPPAVLCYLSSKFFTRIAELHGRYFLSHIRDDFPHERLAEIHAA